MSKMRKKQRIMLVVFGGIALALSTVLVSLAMRDSIVFFFAPTELMAREATGELGGDRRLRVGGLVEHGSIVRGQGEEISFRVTDNESTVGVTFTGVLPDLFREGEGVVAEGYFRGGTFRAEEVLARHDEDYMPKEVAATLKDKGYWQHEEGQAQ